MASGADAAAEHQETFDRHRDYGVAVEALRHIADAQILAPVHRAAIGLFKAQQNAHQRRLAGAVETDERDDLALADIDVDIHQQLATVAGDAKAASGDERGRIDLRSSARRPVPMRAGVIGVVPARLGRRRGHSVARRHWRS